MPPTRRHTDPAPERPPDPDAARNRAIADAVAAHERHTPEGLGECWRLLEALPLPGHDDEDPA